MAQNIVVNTTNAVAVITAEFYSDVAQRMENDCVARLIERGVARNNIFTVRVPGCFELPFAAAEAASTQNFSAIVTLGLVVRGETSHYDYVAGECARGVADVALKHRTPVIFGVLTTENWEQAEARMGGPKGNKARDAADCALTMIGVCEMTSRWRP